MRETCKLIAIPAAICLVAGLALAWVNRQTEGPIQAAIRRARIEALQQALPAHDNDPAEDRYEVADTDPPLIFHVARRDGEYAGAAWSVVSTEGYGGEIEIMIGVDDRNRVQGMAILRQRETPGLGAKIERAEFKDQFAGRPMEDTDWRVRSDGGDIDEITAATLSSEAVVAAVAAGLKQYREHEARIRQAAVDADPE